MKRIPVTLALLLALLTGNAQNNIGLQLYSFRHEFAKDVPGTLQKISAMGIRLIEGGGTYGLPMKEYRELLEKNDLTMISMGASFNELDSNANAVVAEAKEFGAKYVMCAWIPHNDVFTIADADKAIAVFNRAGKLLMENGIIFCYHAHGYEFESYNGRTLFDYMALRMNPIYANFEMDVFWVKQAGQDPISLLRRYPRRFPLMHLKDRKPGTPGSRDGHADEDSNVVLGTGDVGIADIMKAAKEYGVRNFFIEDESSRSMEQVPRSLAFLKGLE
jgi:sugar phosphate isomerase/epimerase